MRIFHSTTWLRLLLLALLLLTCVGVSSSVKGQASAQERADALRLQLEETRSKHESLQARLKELEEELKPENIEKSYAGIGSTKPEELRESRRRQLEVQKAGIEAQIRVLKENETRLEARALEANAEAYQQSAVPNPDPKLQPASKATTVQPRPRRVRNKQERRRVRRVTRN